MGVLVLLSLVLGLRRGEALGLMWNAFDLEARVGCGASLQSWSKRSRSTR
jgi:integrase